jgi:hypothetical protein
VKKLDPTKPALLDPEPPPAEPVTCTNQAADQKQAEEEDNARYLGRVARVEEAANYGKPPADPMLALLSRAVEKGFDADQLGRLVDLQRQVKADQAAEAYAQAMRLAQQEMPTVVRDKVNAGVSKKYATLENVQRAIKPIYTKHGFALSFGTADSPLPDHIRVVCDVHHQGGKTAAYKGDFPTDAQNKAKSGIQATGSTMSYARRYLTLLIFNVTVADEDDDGAGPKITEADWNEIKGLIDELAKLGRPVNEAKLLEWQRIEQLSDLPSKKFGEVIHYLNRKRREPAK